MPFPKLVRSNRPSVETFKRQTKQPLALVLDNIRSGHNVGSAFRTADAFLISKMYLCGITPTPPHRQIRKTSLGAGDAVAWAYAKSTSDLLQQLKQQGYLILVVEQTTSSIALQQLAPLEKKCALVFGNEVLGVSQEALALADKCVEIVQYGTKHSLNVANCMSIVVWELLKDKMHK